MIFVRYGEGKEGVAVAGSRHVSAATEDPGLPRGEKLLLTTGST